MKHIIRFKFRRDKLACRSHMAESWENVTNKKMIDKKYKKNQSESCDMSGKI